MRLYVNHCPDQANKATLELWEFVSRSLPSAHMYRFYLFIYFSRDSGEQVLMEDEDEERGYA